MTSLFKRSAIALALIAPLAAWSQVSVAVNIAPPLLPVYAQPPIPGDGYLWTPGYWAWDAAAGDYEWVPGTWVLPPGVGLLWTPGYWAFGGGGYYWNRGYWGSHVGYYGGLNYGYGYTGRGYAGGNWDHGHFRYNQAVNNVPAGRVRNVYNSPVRGGFNGAHDSYNGGQSHFRGQPTAGDRRFQAAQHAGPTSDQAEHERRAMSMPEQRMGNNHGSPPTAATARPSGFGQPGVEHVRAEPAMGGRPGGEGRPMGGGQLGGGRPMGGGEPGGGHPMGGGEPGGGHPMGGGEPGGGHPMGGGGERPGGGGGGGGHPGGGGGEHH